MSDWVLASVVVSQKAVAQGLIFDVLGFGPEGQAEFVGFVDPPLFLFLLDFLLLLLRVLFVGFFQLLYDFSEGIVVAEHLLDYDVLFGFFSPPAVLPVDLE